MFTNSAFNFKPICVDTFLNHHSPANISKFSKIPFYSSSIGLFIPNDFYLLCFRSTSLLLLLAPRVSCQFLSNSVSAGSASVGSALQLERLLETLLHGIQIVFSPGGLKTLLLSEHTEEAATPRVEAPQKSSDHCTKMGRGEGVPEEAGGHNLGLINRVHLHPSLVSREIRAKRCSRWVWWVSIQGGSPMHSQPLHTVVTQRSALTQVRKQQRPFTGRGVKEWRYFCGDVVSEWWGQHHQHSRSERTSNVMQRGERIMESDLKRLIDLFTLCKEQYLYIPSVKPDMNRIHSWRHHLKERIEVHF